MKVTLIILLAAAIAVGGFVGYRATERKPHCAKVSSPGFDVNGPGSYHVPGSERVVCK